MACNGRFRDSNLTRVAGAVATIYGPSRSTYIFWRYLLGGQEATWRAGLPQVAAIILAVAGYVVDMRRGSRCMSVIVSFSYTIIRPI